MTEYSAENLPGKTVFPTEDEVNEWFGEHVDFCCELNGHFINVDEEIDLIKLYWGDLVGSETKEEMAARVYNWKVFKDASYAVGQLTDESFILLKDLVSRLLVNRCLPKEERTTVEWEPEYIITPILIPYFSMFLFTTAKKFEVDQTVVFFQYLNSCKKEYKEMFGESSDE